MEDFDANLGHRQKRTLLYSFVKVFLSLLSFHKKQLGSMLFKLPFIELKYVAETVFLNLNR